MSRAQKTTLILNLSKYEDRIGAKPFDKLRVRKI